MERNEPFDGLRTPAVELVFHPISTEAPSSAFADAVASVAASDGDELRIVGPYLGGRVLLLLSEEHCRGLG
jgi:hypothetical protein